MNEWTGQNKYDKKALELLKEFKVGLNEIIECLEGGSKFFPSVIGDNIKLSLLLQARDEFTKSLVADSPHLD